MKSAPFTALFRVFRPAATGWLVAGVIAAVSAGCGGADSGSGTSGGSSGGSSSGSSSGATASGASVASASTSAAAGAGTASSSVTASGAGSASNGAAGAGSTYGSLKSASLGAGASLNGALPFPADSAWNTDVSSAPVDPASDALIASIGLTRGLHPDFGSGLWNGAPIGIPYVVVGTGQPMVPIVFTAYGSESDPGPYPVPGDAPIEGRPVDGSSFGGDRHVIVVDRDASRIYELYSAVPRGDGGWNADSGAVFLTDAANPRPTARPGWTSADAAGLPIFPGLVRYDEAAAGAIRHALRFTVSRSRKAYVPPATHWASSSTDPSLPPMGMRVRLKASYAIPASFSAETRAILQALKTYGMFVADNGSDWYLSGAPDARWNNDRLLSELGSVKGASFEVVRMDGLVAP